MTRSGVESSPCGTVHHITTSVVMHVTQPVYHNPCGKRTVGRQCLCTICVPPTVSMSFPEMTQRLEAFAERHCKRKASLAMLGEMCWVLGLDPGFRLEPRDDEVADG